MTPPLKRQAVVYLRTAPEDSRTLELEQQLEHVTAFMTRHGIEEAARYGDLDTGSFEQLHHAAGKVRELGTFLVMDHVDDFDAVVAQLNAAGVNFISAQSANDAVYSFMHGRDLPPS